MSNSIVDEDMAYIFESGLNWLSFKNKTILISGANGFLPSYMVDFLLYLNTRNSNQNTKVIALVRNFDKAAKRFKKHLNNSNLKIVVQDVSQKINLDENVHYIVHAASQASPKYYSTDPVGTINANVFGTSNLLEIAKQYNTSSFLYFSSSEVYGEVPLEMNPIKEDCFGYLNPTSIRACYAESKRMGENICVSWAHQYNLNVKIVRPFHTYGPNMDLNDGRVFADFVADIVMNRDIVMKSDGTAVRAYCYLVDAVIGYFTVLLKGNNGNAYNVGNPLCESSVLELANTLVNAFPEKKLRVIKKEQDNANYLASKINLVTPDIKKIETLGWRPIFSIVEGFTRTVRSYE